KLMSKSYWQAGRDLSVDWIFRRAAEIGEDEFATLYSTHRLRTLLSGGNVGVTCSDLLCFARVLDVWPMMFNEFISGTCTPVSGISLFNLSEQDETMSAPVPPPFVNNPHVLYRIPKARQAKADVGVALIELRPSAVIKPNRHPGHEILIPVQNDHATVEILDCKGRFPLSAGRNFAIFESRRNHVVRNESKTASAKLLVLRCYGTQPEARVT